MPIIEVPEVVRAKARAVGARSWLVALPRLVAELERAWAIEVGAAYTGGTEAYVAAATRADGTPAVLKLLIPRDGDAARNEIAVLRLTDGAGCARLFEADEARSAMLLERLGPSLFELGWPLARRLEVLCAAAERVWRPAAGHGFPNGAEKGRWLIDFIQHTWAELDDPCTERAVAYALDCAERRIAAFDETRVVLVHGDIHQWNALQAEDGGFKLVDPDGLFAEPEYDMGILMREDPVELLAGDPRDRARWLARRTGLDVDAIWEWGVVERVSTGLLCTRIGLQPVGREMLLAADRVAESI